MNKNQNRNQNQNGNRNKNKNQNQALNRNLKYTIPAVLILILELLMLFAPVFSGATALVLLRGLWFTGNTGTRILCAVCLAVCPVAAAILLLFMPLRRRKLPLQLPPVIQEMTAAPVPDASVSPQTYSGNTTGSISTGHTPCAILRFLSGPRAGETASLPDGKTIIIGRNSKDSHIFINDTSISRIHCSVQYQTVRRTFLITDCSSNGTCWSDGRKLPPHTAIEVPNGSVFYLGGKNTSFRLEA